MPNEVIIIDGVNVSGCVHFSQPNNCDNEHTKTTWCDKNNCIYKAYHKVSMLAKSLTVENESLKTKLMQKDEIVTFYNNVDWSSDPCGICKYKQAYDEMKETLSRFEDKND
jgi:hypothetical protein